MCTCHSAWMHKSVHDCATFEVHAHSCELYSKNHVMQHNPSGRRCHPQAACHQRELRGMCTPAQGTTPETCSTVHMEATCADQWTHKPRGKTQQNTLLKTLFGQFWLQTFLFHVHATSVTVQPIIPTACSSDYRQNWVSAPYVMGDGTSA